MPGGDMSWKPPSSIRNRETAGGLFAASPRRKIILKDTGDRTPYAYPTVGSRTRRSYEGGQAGLVSQPATQVDNALASERLAFHLMWFRGSAGRAPRAHCRMGLLVFLVSL